MSAGTIAIAGVTPRHVVTPRSIGELSDAVRTLYAAGRTFAFVGGGTHLDLGNAPRALDTVVRTNALDVVVDYTPEDQTITVEAGMTLAELDGILAEHGQMLPLDVADRARATVGGTVASNAYGRRRQRFGTVKDLIVGVGIVRPDGVRARGGGKVVKNVAGFDLPKLMTGSLGTLGAIASVTLRVYPLPEAVRAVCVTLSSSGAMRAVTAALVEHRLEPESVALYKETSLVVTFSGTRAGVATQVRTLTETIALRASATARELSDLERESYEQRERAVRRDGVWQFHLSAPPAVPVAALGAYVRAAALAVPVAYPMLGVALHAFAENAAVDGLREHVACETGGRGRVVVARMPAAARAYVDAWGTPPSSLGLMRSLKQAFDPRGLCNPGRFIGGL